MRRFGRPRGLLREWMIGLSACALIIAPFGCEFESQLLDDLLNGNSNSSGGGSGGGSAGTSTRGLFINQDAGSDLIAGGRDGAGNACFVFGQREATGALIQVTSVAVRSASGQESSINFDSGWPVYARGPDGSYISIFYSEVSTQRFSADIELYDAGTNQKSFYQVEIDLAKTVEQITELIESITGKPIEAPVAKALSEMAPTKQDSRSVRITVLSPLFVLFVVPLVLAVQFTIIVLGQVLAAVYALVIVAIQATLLVVFSPLFLLANVLSDALIRIEFLPLGQVFDRLPPPPVVVLL